MTIDLMKLATLAMVGGVFVYGLNRGWEGVYMVFGIVFLMGSCQLLGVK